MRLKRRVLSIAALLLLMVAAAYVMELAIPKHDYFIDRIGTVQHQRLLDSRSSESIEATVQIWSSTGLEVTMRVLRPADAAGRKMPLLLIIGGQRTGKDAVDLVGKPSGIVIAALDYPYTRKRPLADIWDSVSLVPDVQQAFLDTPPSLCLALSWLLQQPWVDPERVELAGLSLGVPFAAAAGAVDARFSRVWLIHGGGDNLSWVMHNTRDDISNETLRKLAARTLLFFTYGNSFDTGRRMADIAPRPLVIVAAPDDDFVPEESLAPLVDAAKGKHVELLWTSGRHVGPRRPDELQLLLRVWFSAESARAILRRKAPAAPRE